MSSSARLSPAASFAVVILAGVGAVALAGWRLSAAETSARTAAAATAECARLGAAIIELRGKPQRAVFVTEAEVDFTELFDRAAESVEIDSTAIQSVTPGQPRRMQQNPAYLQVETNVQLGPLPTAQLLRLLYRVVELDPSSTFARIDLVGDVRRGGASTEDLWTTNLTLTRLIYAPIRGVPSQSRPPLSGPVP